jgi:hypothetical protein
MQSSSILSRMVHKGSGTDLKCTVKKINIYIFMLKMSLISLFVAKYMISMLTGSVECSEIVKNRKAYDTFETKDPDPKCQPLARTKHFVVNKEN